MKSILRLKWIVLLISLVLVLAVLFKFRGGREPELEIKPGIEGTELVYLGFDRDNRQSVEIRCRESRSGEHGRIIMTDVFSRIFRKGRMKGDMIISGESGEVTADYREIRIKDNARIESETFSMNADRFSLLHGDYLMNLEWVDFSNRDNLRGRALKGMEFFLENDGIRLFQVSGTWSGDRGAFDFKTEKLWIFDEPQLLMMYGGNSMVSAEAELRGAFLAASLADGFQRLLSVTVEGDAFFSGRFNDGDELWQDRRGSGGMMKSEYDLNGKLSSILIMDQAEAKVEGPDEWYEALSDHMKMDFTEERLSAMRLLAPGMISGGGANEFKLAGDRVTAAFGKDGELRDVIIEGTAFFQARGIRAEGDRIRRSFANGTISVQGRPALVMDRENRFSADRFQGFSEKGEMVSQGPVKSVVVFSAEEGVFSGDDCFISAGSLHLLENGAVIRYGSQVVIVQNKMNLKADKVNFDRRVGGMEAFGKVEMQLTGNDDALSMSGDSIVYQAGENRLIIDGNCRITSSGNSLRSKRASIILGEDRNPMNIEAWEVTEFRNQEVSGRAREMHWDYRGQLVRFSGQARINRIDGGGSEGDELELDLKSGLVRVQDRSRRSRTKIGE